MPKEIVSKYKRFLPTKKHCYFCVNGIKEINYRDVGTLKRYLSSYATIIPRKRSGVCSKHQRKLARAIKRARFMALLPYVRS
ncbi:MAG: 30S ribosomal protein S18 [Candidatus Aenigmarchaeota archaeon]|nr:30S ribosomal protein S18 [Candidatus Aenigmarchaeota archaeon]